MADLKPSNPTPVNLQRYNLSLFDELAPQMYGPMLYYYLSAGNNDERCHKLEQSLSHILIKFYPLAGRYMEDAFCIHCGDQGVECIEAQVNGELATFLQPSDSQMHILSKFLPWDLNTVTHSTTRPLFAVQINTFDCGGMVIGICISHYFADAFTLATFMKEWAKTSRTGMREELYLGFGNLSSLFPARTSSLFKIPPYSTNDMNSVTNIFFFDQTKIASINESLVDLDGHFSKVVVVTAVTRKALLEVSLTKDGDYRDSVVFSAMNMRGRSKATPPTLDISCGNFITSVKALFEAKKSKAQLHDLVVLVRSAMERKGARFEEATVDDVLSMFLKGAEEVLQAFRGDMDLYLCSSLCRLPMYETDFGWGKPHWVSDATRTFGGNIMLMHSNSGGIQACITLREEDMNIFQKNLDIYASKPSSI